MRSHDRRTGQKERNRQTGADRNSQTENTGTDAWWETTEIAMTTAGTGDRQAATQVYRQQQAEADSKTDRCHFRMAN